LVWETPIFQNQGLLTFKRMYKPIHNIQVTYTMTF